MTKLMITTEIVEGLLFKYPEMRQMLIDLNIISEERRISSSEHPEYNHLLSLFKKANVIAVIGVIQTTIFISQKKKGRIFDVMIIKGNSTKITQMSKTLIIKTLVSLLNWKDYLPEPFVRKIVYINHYNEKIVSGIVFSEFGKNTWTLEDPMFIDIKNFRSITGREIINEIVNDATGG